jgi:hypothetical protein
MGWPLLFLVDRRDPGTLRDWLAWEGRAVAVSAGLLTYQELLRRQEIEAAVCVFTDFDRLTPALRSVVESLWTQLEGAGVRLLNDPGRVLDRKPLLDRLSALGRNEFRAHPPDAVGPDARFPVFVRRQSEHDGPLTPLLRDRAALEASVRRLTWPRGPHRRRDLLVVEFCDTSDGTGWFTKYAAQIVGDRILPRHRLQSQSWAIKGSEALIDTETTAAEREYLARNPHRDWIRETFALAGVEYGRLDYGLRDGRPQAFEINTNPSLGPRALADPRRRRTARVLQLPRRDIHERFHSGMRHAVRALARSGGASRRVALDLAATQKARYRLERVRLLLDAAWRLGWVAALRRSALREPSSLDR